MATISLRKAAHIRKSIETEIDRLRPKPKKNRYGMEDEAPPKFRANAAISVFAKPEQALADATAKFEAELTLVRALERILGSIRAAVTEANGTSGIARLMAQAAALRAESKRIDESLEGVEAANLEQLKLAVELNRKRFDASAGNVQETVTVGVLDADKLAELKAESARLRREANVCDDRVAELNVETKIEFGDADYDYLKSFGIV